MQRRLNDIFQVIEICAYQIKSVIDMLFRLFKLSLVFNSIFYHEII